ncbi:MAG: SDR family NAD(P)-dependent oxidoreductase [Nitrosomonadaceae bacterium]
MKAVLVTGANSGVGLITARRLAAHGFFVYAGIRNPERLHVFRKVENVEAIKLDVTSQTDIDAAVTHIEAQGRGLYGVVNNAGIQRFSKMNTISDDELYEIFNTNTFGPLRINKAFAPMLAASGGRTVAIGSISGHRPCFGSGIYGMAKAALTSYTDSYVREMQEIGVHVCIIEPGGYNTNILINADNESLPDDVREGIQKKLRAFKFMGKEPHEVADVVLDVLTTENPKRRYMVVPREQQAQDAIMSVLTRAAELNSTQEYEFNKDEMISMLVQLLDEFSSE